MSVASRRLVPATLLALLGSLVLAVPADAADTGSITGTVTARPAGGAFGPHAGASIVLDRLRPDGFFDNQVATGVSEPDGSFEVDGLADGRYQIRTYPAGYVHAEAEQGDYGYEYYDDRNGPSGADLVEVAGGAVTQLDHTIELRPIGRVTGRVLDEQGKPVAGSVLIAPTGGGGASVATDAQGYYDSLDDEWSQNLIPGSYEAFFSPAAWEIGAPLYYLDELPAEVQPGQTTTVNFTLVRRPTATFTVLDADGKPLAGAPIEFQVRNAGGDWDYPQYGPNETDALGRYRFTDNADEVKIRFGLPDGYLGDSLPEWWDDATGFETAQVLSFPDGVQLDRQFTVQLARAATPPTIPTIPTTPAAPVVAAGSPTIAGSARVGGALTVAPGSWGPDGVQLSHQWLADGVPISGATAPTYSPTNAVAGKRISVRVTGALPGATPVSATSASTAAVVGRLTTARPQVKGKARVGGRLTAVAGAWGPAPVTLRYQWLRAGKVVKGRAARTYRLTKADRGKRITVRVTGLRTSYATVALTSRPTAGVRAR